MSAPVYQTLGTLRPTELSPHRKRLSTDEAPAVERFSYWVDLICAIYAQLECDRPADVDVFGEIEFSQLGPLDFTHLRSNVPRVWRTGSMICHDEQDRCLVQIQRGGRSVVRQDGREAMLVPGDFVIYDTTRPYELHFEDEFHDLVVMRLPRAALASHIANLEELTAMTVPHTSAAGNLLLSMVDTLQRDLDRLHPSSVIGVSEGITSIIAAGLRSLPSANMRHASSLSAYHVMRVKAYVMERLRDPNLSIASIATAMRLSPDHLSRLFRSEPVPLSRMIWRQRLEACRRELSDPRQARRSVSKIAFSWGFHDAAHFSRSFKEQYGATPREWRQQVLGQDLGG